jgi:hypothetical protein
MKRGFLAATVLGALACAAVALGATKPYFYGKDSDSQCGQVPHTTCTVTFSGVKGKHGRIKKVTNFVFDRVPDTCDQGSFAFTIKGNPVPAMRVNNHRKFSAHYAPNSKETIDVTGKFSKNFRKASGTLRDQGDFPPQATGCDTGVDDYSVKRLQTTGG